MTALFSMKSIRLWKALSAASLGTGIFIGVKWSKDSQRDDSWGQSGLGWLSASSKTANHANGICDPTTDWKWSRSWCLDLSLPTVEATSPLIPPGGFAEVMSVNKINSELIRFGPPGSDNVKVYEDFIVSYDRRNRTAHWVFEHLTKEKVARNDKCQRDDCVFFEDPTVHDYFLSTNGDYRGTGYDRGHLAAAANHRWSQTAMDQTFVFTNISPQVGRGFNRDAWEQLERYVRLLTKDFKNVYVCTGPLYLPRREMDGKLYVKYEVLGKNHVAVPTHFFKVVVMESHNGQYEMLSFVMPNQVLPDKVDLKHYLVPVDTIERAAGLLFFNRIPRNALKRINGRKM